MWQGRHSKCWPQGPSTGSSQAPGAPHPTVWLPPPLLHAFPGLARFRLCDDGWLFAPRTLRLMSQINPSLWLVPLSLINRGISLVVSEFPGLKLLPNGVGRPHLLQGCSSVSGGTGGPQHHPHTNICWSEQPPLPHAGQARLQRTRGPGLPCARIHPRAWGCQACQLVMCRRGCDQDWGPLEVEEAGDCQREQPARGLSPS